MVATAQWLHSGLPMRLTNPSLFWRTSKSGPLSCLSGSIHHIFRVLRSIAVRFPGDSLCSSWFPRSSTRSSLESVPPEPYIFACKMAVQSFHPTKVRTMPQGFLNFDLKSNKSMSHGPCLLSSNRILKLVKVPIHVNCFAESL